MGRQQPSARPGTGPCGVESPAGGRLSSRRQPIRPSARTCRDAAIPVQPPDSICAVCAAFRSDFSPAVRDGGESGNWSTKPSLGTAIIFTAANRLPGSAKTAPSNIAAGITGCFSSFRKTIPSHAEETVIFSAPALAKSTLWIMLSNSSTYCGVEQW